MFYVDISLFLEGVGPKFYFLGKNWVCNIQNAAIIKKISFLFLFLIFFILRISNLSIYLKSSKIVITGRPDICPFQWSHIWDTGHGWVHVFWLS